MKRLYDVRTCKCGRIHMIPKEKINKVLEKDKNLLVICAGCGAITIIGANIENDWDEPDKTCYMMYSAEFSPYGNKSIFVSDFETTENEKGIEEIFYSHGIKVPMMTGYCATNYFDGNFYDR